MEQDGNEHSAGLVSTFTKEEQRTCCKKWTTCLLSPTTIFQSEASQNILGQYLMHCSANIIHQYGTCEAGNHILGYLSGSSHQYLLFTCVAFAWRCNFTAIFCIQNESHALFSIEELYLRELLFLSRVVKELVSPWKKIDLGKEWAFHETIDFCAVTFLAFSLVVGPRNES